MWLGLVSAIQLHRQTSLPLGLMKFYVTHQYSCYKWVQRRWWPSRLRAAPGRRWPAPVAGRYRGATCTVRAGGLSSWNPARWTGSPLHCPEGSETERECRVHKRCDRGLVLGIFLQNQKYDITVVTKHLSTCLPFSTSRSSSLISSMYGRRGNPGALRPMKKSSPVLM